MINAGIACVKGFAGIFLFEVKGIYLILKLPFIQHSNAYNETRNTH